MRAILPLALFVVACAAPRAATAQEVAPGEAPAPVALHEQVEASAAVGVVRGSDLAASPCARALPIPTRRPPRPTLPMPEARGEGRALPIPDACSGAPRVATGPATLTPVAVSTPNPVLEIVEP